MRPPALRPDELVVDAFAGGGGASLGIAMAVGRPVDIAIDHDPEAVAMHAANHPRTLHVVEDVWHADYRHLVAGRPVGLAWFSPDCRHFSRAKSGRPVHENIRGLAWVVARWARLVRPRVIILENVGEFRDWGPLTENDQGELVPDPDRKGETFRRWVREIRRAGYNVDWRELRACDYGAPTIRKRLFVIARCDGAPIVWPEATHGPGLLPYRTAAECIDWSIPCPSIFDRTKPLAEATVRRIAEGIRRYVIDHPDPFIVPLTAANRDGPALAVAHMEQANTGLVGHDVREPLSTIVGKGCTQRLVTTYLVRDQTHTLTAGGSHMGEARAFLLKYYSNGSQWQDCREPMHTLTTKDRLGLVMVRGQPYQVVDIGMRMLTPRELFRAQGFPDHYVIDPIVDGRPLAKTAQIRMCGNSVCPQVAAALVRANLSG